MSVTTPINIRMQIHEVVKPAPPEQQRVTQLKSQLDAARRAAKQARLNQQQVRITQQRQNLNQTPQ